MTNLRQILDNKLHESKDFCSCIRSREVKKRLDMLDYVKCVVREYSSSGGQEYFISMETGNTPVSVFNNGNWYSNNKREPGIIYGFLRLRICKKGTYFKNKYFPELENSGLVRELHVLLEMDTH